MYHHHHPTMFISFAALKTASVAWLRLVSGCATRRRSATSRWPRSSQSTRSRRYITERFLLCLCMCCVYTCVSIYVCICMYICIYIYVCIYICVCMCVCVFVYIYMYIYIYICIYVYLYIYTYKYMFTYIYIYGNTHTATSRWPRSSQSTRSRRYA